MPPPGFSKQAGLVMKQSLCCLGDKSLWWITQTPTAQAPLSKLKHQINYCLYPLYLFTFKPANRWNKWLKYVTNELKVQYFVLAACYLITARFLVLSFRPGFIALFILQRWENNSQKYRKLNSIRKKLSKCSIWFITLNTFLTPEPKMKSDFPCG